MSIRVMSAVYDSELTDIYEVSVMLALANHADDDGVCYPSIARISRLARMSERGVQCVIKRLSERGYLDVDAGAGRSGTNLYIVRPTPAPGAPPATHAPRTRCTTPPHPTTFTPAPGAPEPSITIIEPSIEAASAKPPKRRCRIPPDWVPSDRNIQDAIDRQFSASDIENEACKFRDHHLAKASLFADWDAAWRTWLGNARKFGARGGMAGKASPVGYGRGSSIASIVARRHTQG